MDELILQNQNLNEEIKKLKEENIQLNQLITELKEHLKKYTSPERAKKYNQIHKEEIKIYKKEYNKNYNKNYKITPEKRAEYNKIYYQKKKEKTNKENLESENIKENN